MGSIAALLVIGSIAALIPQRARALEEVTEEEEDISPSSGRVSRRFGVGLILGEPTALTGKLFFDAASAAQLHIGYAFGRQDKLVIIVDFLYHFNHVVPPIERAGRLAPYVGVGGRFGIHDDDPLLGVRVPLGLSFMLRGAPIEIFVEVAIGIGILPKTAAIVDGGLGGRFYF